MNNVVRKDDRANTLYPPFSRHIISEEVVRMSAIRPLRRTARRVELASLSPCERISHRSFIPKGVWYQPPFPMLSQNSQQRLLSKEGFVSTQSIWAQSIMAKKSW